MRFDRRFQFAQRLVIEPERCKLTRPKGLHDFRRCGGNLTGEAAFRNGTRRWRGQDSIYESLREIFVEPMIKTGTGNFSTSLGIARSRTTCSKSYPDGPRAVARGKPSTAARAILAASTSPLVSALP